VRQWPYAGFVTGYSGGTVPIFHRLPYYALYWAPVIIKNIELLSTCQGKTPSGSVSVSKNKPLDISAKSSIIGACLNTHENEQEKVYPPYQCLFKEGGEPGPCRLHAFHVL
jgi:hypothetical protein